VTKKAWDSKEKYFLKINLLILDQLADEYKKALQSKFPEIMIHASIKEEEIGDFIEKVNVLLTFRISDGLIKRAKNLQWIQSMASGVDAIVNLPSLRKEVLLTSTRGIHAPQMAEMAILLMLSLNRNFPQIIRNQDKGIWEAGRRNFFTRKKWGSLA
jgi:phosphoglycerate dehydrogenase-like enzyme